MMNKLEKMRAGLRSLESSDELGEVSNIITKISNPPSYMVEFLLFGIKNLKRFPLGEKETWRTSVLYKKQLFNIRDYKFGTWSIEGTSEDKQAKQLAKEIQSTITRGCESLDKILEGAFRKYEVNKGNFYLNNSFTKLYSMYQFFEEKVNQAIEDYKTAERKAQNQSSTSRSPTGGIERTEGKIAEFILNKISYQYSKPPIITNYSFALMSVFYSILDFLLYAVYAFEQPMKFSEFKHKRWAEKFAMLFPVKKDPKFKSIYDDLIQIKGKYRNPLTHGLIDENVSFLVPFPKIGLIPVSYRHLSYIHDPFVHMQVDEAQMIIERFQNFFKYLENNDPYWYYLSYVKYAFPVPMNKKEISKIKKEMTSREKFTEHLDHEAKLQEMIINREI